VIEREDVSNSTWVGLAEEMSRSVGTSPGEQRARNRRWKPLSVEGALVRAEHKGGIWDMEPDEAEYVRIQNGHNAKAK
jgi:hypothetical protein